MCGIFKCVEVDHRKWRTELTPDEGHSVLKVLARELSQCMLPKPNNLRWNTASTSF